MNLGWTSLAAPKAASSKVSRYSQTARGESAGSIYPASHSSFGVEFCLFASVSIRLAYTAMRRSLTRPSSMPRATVASNRCATVHCHGTGRGGSWRRSSDPDPGRPDRADETNDTRGSDAPPRTAAAPIGCRSNSRPAACGSAARGRQTGARYGCRNRRGRCGSQTGPRTGGSSARDGFEEHGPRARTRRTAPVAPSAAVPSSPILPPNTGIETAEGPSIKPAFFNGTRPN